MRVRWELAALRTRTASVATAFAIGFRSGRVRRHVLDLGAGPAWPSTLRLTATLWAGRLVMITLSSGCSIGTGQRRRQGRQASPPSARRRQAAVIQSVRSAGCRSASANSRGEGLARRAPIRQRGGCLVGRPFPAMKRGDRERSRPYPAPGLTSLLHIRPILAGGGPACLNRAVPFGQGMPAALADDKLFHCQLFADLRQISSGATGKPRQHQPLVRRSRGRRMAVPGLGPTLPALRQRSIPVTAVRPLIERRRPAALD